MNSPTKFDQLPADRLEDATRDINALMDLFGRKRMTAPLTRALADWGVKRCKSCKSVKHTEDFGNDVNTSDGLNGQCRECANARGRQHHTDSYTSTRRAPIEPQGELAESDLPFASNVVNGMMEILGVDRIVPSVGDVFTAYEVKRCHSCKQLKRPASFNKKARNRDGREKECRECQRERSRRYASEHKEEARERTAQWRADNQIRRRLYAGKVRAERAGVTAVEITEEVLISHWESRGIDPGKCFYTGEELTPENISLDHATPFKRGGGHTVDNIVPCTWAVNDRKNTMTAEEFADLLAAEKETNNNE